MNYQPFKLVYCFVTEEDAFGTDQPMTTVWFSDYNYFKKHGHLNDSLGQHNVDNNILRICGVEPCELMENNFEIKAGYEVSDVHKCLKESGFNTDPAFTQKMRGFIPGE